MTRKDTVENAHKPVCRLRGRSTLLNRALDGRWEIHGYTLPVSRLSREAKTMRSEYTLVLFVSSPNAAPCGRSDYLGHGYARKLEPELILKGFRIAPRSERRALLLRNSLKPTVARTLEPSSFSEPIFLVKERRYNPTCGVLQATFCMPVTAQVGMRSPPAPHPAPTPTTPAAHQICDEVSHSTKQSYEGALPEWDIRWLRWG